MGDVRSQVGRFKRTCLHGSDKTTIVDHLWACCSNALEDAILKHVGKNLDTEEEMLEPMKKLGVRKRNALLNKVHFLNMAQNDGEPAKHYVARLKGQAATCDFKLPTGVTDYTEQMVQHQLVRGLNDPQIQEHILSHAATEEGSTMDLGQTINMIEAKECGKIDTESLQKSAQVHRMSEYRKGKKDGPLCEYCGLPGHGKSSEEKTRRKECPAYSQFCGKCGAKGHFKSTCKKGSKASVRAATGQNSDESSSSESSSESFVGTVNGTGQFCGLTAL